MVAQLNTVQGNLIGTDATGTSALPNGDNGVVIEDPDDNLVGGTTAGARNVITANAIGVLLSMGATGNTIQGNYIGTDVTGLIDLGSDDLYGVNIADSPGNLIGGSVPGAGNLISGNFNNIRIEGVASTGNLIQGNLIGTDVTGRAGIDFFGAGIVLVSGSGTIIGGPAGSGNVIAFNGDGGGIAVVSASTGNNIFGNSIFANDGIGINLLGGVEDPATGVTANDFPDADAGANNLQNYPVISEIATSGSDRTVEGSLTSNPNTAYVLNFYSNAEVDASGYGEGETWLGSLDVQTNAQSSVDFSFPLESRQPWPLHHRDRDRPGRQHFRILARQRGGPAAQPLPQHLHPAPGPDRRQRPHRRLHHHRERPERSDRARDRAVVRRFWRGQPAGQSLARVELPRRHYGGDEQQLARHPGSGNHRERSRA